MSALHIDRHWWLRREVHLKKKKIIKKVVQATSVWLRCSNQIYLQLRRAAVSAHFARSWWWWTQLYMNRNQQMNTRTQIVYICILEWFINFVAIVTHFIIPVFRQQTAIHPYWIIAFYTRTNFQQVQHVKINCMKNLHVPHFEMLVLVCWFSQLLHRLFCAQNAYSTYAGCLCSTFYTHFKHPPIPQSAEWSMNLSNCLS